jgi:predicted nucleotidyltransferase
MTAHAPIEIDLERVAEFCRQRGSCKLSLFGSVVRDDFAPARSDVDVLAEFRPGALDGIGWEYFGYGEELGAILGRRVDFCSRLSPELLPRVREEMVTMYEQP